MKIDQYPAQELFYGSRNVSGKIFFGVAGLSLAGGTALCPRAGCFILNLVPITSKKTHLNMSEKLTWALSKQDSTQTSLLSYSNFLEY